MKTSRQRLLPLGLLCLLILPAFAAAADIPVDAKGLPLWEIRQWHDHPVRLELADAAALQRLLAEVPLAGFDREQIRPDAATGRLVFTPRVTDAEQAALADRGWNPVAVRDVEREGREALERAWAARAAKADGEKVFTFPLTVYPTHAEIGTIIDDIVAAHPAIARPFQWGSSVQGRQLWGIVISDDVYNSTDEPEVRLSSSIHGDEVVGMVLMLDFANYLTANYGQPGYEDVTNLVDNYEIHIMPLHNPDGMVAGQRYNANGEDLNRNFPEPAGTSPTQEIETQNFMMHANSHHFVISENFHGGALVANYAWDYTYTRAPDDAALIKLSLEYSTYNLPMYNGAFDQGITNGADWYTALGTLQDWSYDQTDCMDVTLEVSNTKWPTASTLLGYWNDNRESLMHYVKAARYGVHGVVTDANTGDPVDATVSIAGNTMPVHTDPEHGDYYKLLASGTYDLTFSATGYLPQTITGVSTVWGAETIQDVQLQPLPRGEITGLVRSAGGAPLAAQVQAFLQPADELQATTTAAGDGTYALGNLPYGDYRLVYTLAGYFTGEQTVTVAGPTVAAPDMALATSVEVTLFATDFEDQSGAGWTGAWGSEATGADGTAYHWSDSPGGNYAASTYSPCAMDAGVDLSAVMSGTVSFWAKWTIEADWDGCSFQVSVDGGANWTPVTATGSTPGTGQGTQLMSQPYFDGTQTTWLYSEIDLAPWLGQADVRFRFVMASDTSIQRDGFHFDQFVIRGLKQDDLSAAGDTPDASHLLGVYPNPFNPTTRVVFDLARDADAKVCVYDVTGRLVRTLVHESLSAGRHEVPWNGLTDQHTRAASGVYMVRLEAGDVRQTVKALLVK